MAAPLESASTLAEAQPEAQFDDEMAVALMADQRKLDDLHAANLEDDAPTGELMTWMGQEGGLPMDDVGALLAALDRDLLGCSTIRAVQNLGNSIRPHRDGNSASLAHQIDDRIQECMGELTEAAKAAHAAGKDEG